MDRELTVVEIIGLGIRSEEDASKFYGSLSKKIQNELVRAKYEGLAREEEQHRRMLVGLYQKMTGEKNPPVIPGNPATAEGGGAPLISESIEELLQYAIEREREACEFYRRLAPKMSEPTSRRTIEYLADIERGHEGLIRSELEAYQRDKNWYADKPDIQLVGP
ncbi:MAG: ferritin family protein [bacterium]